MRFTRRRSDRPEPARSRQGSSLEMLEGRTLLSTTAHPFAPFLPADLPVTNPVTQQRIPFFSIDPLAHQVRVDPQGQFVNNEGKVVSGKNRQSDEWTITVHGPGTVLVTDVTPNDGVLDDNIDTIQLLNTDPHRTYVTGQTVASAQVQTNGTVLFNRLIDTSGVKSVVLNGFSLAETVTPPSPAANQNPSLFLNTGIFLTGGVGLLQFHDIIAPIDLAAGTPPINIVIGDPSTALPPKDRPIIRLDSIFNTVTNSGSPAVPSGPQTDPTVNIVVNGELHGLDFISTTNVPVVSAVMNSQVFTGEENLTPVVAGQQFLFPTVGTTGRTAVQAIGIDHLKARGTANNFTASRGGPAQNFPASANTMPFQNGFTGLDHLGTATFGGNADAVGLDVNGKIGSLKFARGLGNPTGTTLAATSFGTPADQMGYPAHDLLGGLVTSRRIGHIKAFPADADLQTPTNPDFVQLYRQGNPTYFPKNGNALTSVAIVSSGSIGQTTIVGNTVNSEIKSGFDYPSFAAGLEGTRAPSTIAPVRQRGDSVNGVVSATYRPNQHQYGTTFDTAGPGTIRGKLKGVLYSTGGVTSLGNQGAGFFARRRIGYLPPPQLPKRVHGVLVR